MGRQPRHVCLQTTLCQVSGRHINVYCGSSLHNLDSWKDQMPQLHNFIFCRILFEGRFVVEKSWLSYWINHNKSIIDGHVNFAGPPWEIHVWPNTDSQIKCRRINVKMKFLCWLLRWFIQCKVFSDHYQYNISWNLQTIRCDKLPTPLHILI